MRIELSLFGWTLYFIPLNILFKITIFHFIADDIPGIHPWMCATVICRGSGVSIGIIRSYWPRCSPITYLVLEADSRKPLRPQRVYVRENVTGSTAEMFHHCQQTLLFPVWQTLDYSRDMLSFAAMIKGNSALVRCLFMTPLLTTSHYVVLVVIG